ncbi:MAG TPA: chemotaxis protein CheW [Anaeromyxobacteraceae bacterium]|nr:chemotaxis protein CheW [Anaeromyxobacteraceae bacterium]
MAADAAQPIAEARHVLFRAGGERFALPLSAVREVVLPQPPFARVPRSGPAVRGAMNLRGRVIALVELGALLELPHERLGPTAGQVLVLEGERPGLGVVVQAVLGVEVLGAGEPATVLDGAALQARAAAQFGGRA